jgi:hypothetical protein
LAGLVLRVYLGVVEDNEGPVAHEDSELEDGAESYGYPADEPAVVCPVCGLEDCGHNLPFVEKTS